MSKIFVEGFYFDEKTEKNVIREILKAYNGKYRIRIWYGDEKKTWNEEHDIIGNVGRSTGKIKNPKKKLTVQKVKRNEKDIICFNYIIIDAKYF